MTPRRFMPALLLLFVASGCAALIYEIVWFQLLQLVIGSSAVSLGVLLGTFMGGMCLGSFLLPRYISAREHPLRVYAWLEIGIGVLGLLVLFGMPLLASIYTAWGGSGPFGLVFRGIAASICLLPPTMLMGATLPAMSRWVETSPQAWRGSATSTAATPAAPSSAACSPASTCCACTTWRSRRTSPSRLNVLVGALALLVARVTPYDGRRWLARDTATAGGRRLGGLRRDRALRHDRAGVGGDLDAHAVAALRRDGLHLLADPRGVPLRHRHRQQRRLGAGAQPRAAAARARLGADAAVRRDCWAAYMLALSLPFWPINPSISTSPWYNFQLDLARAFWVVLPASILWGASFPLALASVATKGQDPGAAGRRRLRRQHRRRDRRRASAAACCWSPGSAPSTRSRC